ncbi:acyltransferase [Agrobacterium tumefaciens]|nr:acyltransferase [Agrobacterium tumefaciens]
MQNHRLKYLDSLRGIAVLMVLMVHSTELSKIEKFRPMIKNFVESGIYGVQLFFIISAFTLFYTLNNQQKTNLIFYLRRFFRIAPAYYIAIIFYSWYNNTWGLGELLNFTFLHGFSPRYINSIVPGGWSIGIEMFFYLFVPFLFKNINSLNKALYFLLFTLLFKTAAFYLIKLSVFSSIQADGSFIYFWFPNQLPIFAIGFILHFYLLNDLKSPLQLYKVLMLIIGLVIVSIMTALPIFSNHFIIASAFALGIALLKKSKLDIYLEQKLLLFIGKISYSAYLCQYGLIFLISKIKFYNFIPEHITGSDYLNFAINLIVLTIMTLLTAFLLYICIEKPFQKFGSKIIAKYFSNQHPLIFVKDVSKIN